MADTEKTVAYGITAEASSFEKGMKDAADSAKNAASNIDSSFKKVGEAFASVQKQLLILASLVAGGAFFKEAISASNELTGETMKLSKMLSITGEEAATLRTALDDIGSNGDDYVATFSKFARQLKTNEAGLQSLGLQTRDSNGNLRDSNTLFGEALRSVSDYKAGLDQNTYAQTLFGKSIDDVMKFQKLNTGVLEEARQKNEELGLTISQDNVAASKAYKMAMNDVGDVLTAVKKTIGDAVMPVFTELAEYFATTGPYVVQVFKGAMMGLLAVFEVLKGAVKTVSGVIFESISFIVDGVGLIGDVFSKMFSGDFSGAYESAKQLGTRYAQAWSNSFRNFLDAGNETGDAVKRHMERLYGDKTEVAAPKSGSKTMGDFGKSNGKESTSRMSQWEARLAEDKSALERQGLQEGQYREMGKAAEKKYWSDLKNQKDLTDQERLALSRKVSETEMAMVKDQFEVDVAKLQAEAAAYKNDTDLRLYYEREIQSKYREGTKQYEESAKRIVEIQRQASEQVAQIKQVEAQATRDYQLSQVASQEQQAQLERDLLVINDSQLISLREGFEQKRYQIAMQALQERQQLMLGDVDSNPVQLAQLHAQIEQLEQQHQLKLSEIRGQASLQQTANSRQVFNATANAMQSSLSRMLQGQGTFNTFMQASWKGLQAAIADVLAQMLMDVIKNTAAAAAVKKALAVFDISTDAARAGAGAAASAASTPVVGWLTAPIAAAATFSMASAFAGRLPSFSAAGGFDIPASVNPIVQAHAREMILPAKHADVIRNMADQGQPGAAVGDVNLIVNAVDAKSVERLFRDNGHFLVAELKRQRRNFAY